MAGPIIAIPKDLTSSRVLVQVDLRRGIFKQYCFDHDCRLGGFRGSDELPIPPSLISEFSSEQAAAIGAIAPAALASGGAGLAIVADGGPGAGEPERRGDPNSCPLPLCGAASTLALCHTSSNLLAGTQEHPAPQEHPDWLSEAELAALPLDDIVASQELSAACAAGEIDGADTERAVGGEVSEEALAAIPLDDIVANHRAAQRC